MDPKDPRPVSNISAIKFEQGDYNASLSSLEKALSLYSDEPDESPKKQKLYTRMVRCHLHSLSPEKAADVTSMLVDEESGKSLRSAAEEMQKLWSNMPKEATLRKQIIDRLPRYKSHL